MDINLRAMVETSLLAGCLNVSGYPPLADAASKDRSKMLLKGRNLLRAQPSPSSQEKPHSQNTTGEQGHTTAWPLVPFTFLILPPDFFTISSSTMDCKQMLIIIA